MGPADPQHLLGYGPRRDAKQDTEPIMFDRDNPRLCSDGPERMCFAGKRRPGRSKSRPAQ